VQLKSRKRSTKPNLYHRFRQLPVWAQSAIGVTAVGLMALGGLQDKDSNAIPQSVSTSVDADESADTTSPSARETTTAADTSTSGASHTTEAVRPSTTTASTSPTVTVATTTTVPAPNAPSVTVVAFGESLVIDWTDTGDVEVNVFDSSGTSIFSVVGSTKPVIVPAAWSASYKVQARVVTSVGASDWVTSDFVMPAAPPPPPPIQPAVDLPAAPATDPRYGTCKEAKANGADTPYVRGQDPEYNWYDDRDNDGVVCE
jgi:Excalibur calcium-binding domain